MTNGELKYPKWQAEFQEVVLEFDRENLVAKIQRFETVVFARVQELAPTSDYGDERQAIDDALTTIRILKQENLDRPRAKARAT